MKSFPKYIGKVSLIFKFFLSFKFIIDLFLCAYSEIDNVTIHTVTYFWFKEKKKSGMVSWLSFSVYCEYWAILLYKSRTVSKNMNSNIFLVFCDDAMSHLVPQATQFWFPQHPHTKPCTQKYEFLLLISLFYIYILRLGEVNSKYITPETQQ